MNKQKKGLVPELRFSEFLSNSGWETVYGNKAFEQISNKDHNSDLPILAITQEYGAIPREMIDYNVSVTEKSVQSYKVVDVGDFIISLRSFQGGIEHSEYKGLCSPAYVILRNKKGIDKRFFKQYFKTKSFIRDLTKNLEGLRDGKMISYKQFSEVLLPKPPTEEQQKIADCLVSIDELITLHTQKLAALRDHKQGLIQQLFPAEGESVPKLRFPEFRGKAGWAEKRFENIIKIISGKGFKASEYASDGVRLIQIENVGYGVTNWTKDTVHLPDAYLAEYPALVLHEGDIVLALNRPVTNDQLKIARIGKLDSPSILYQRVGKLKIIGKAVLPDFAFHICRQFIRDFVIKKSIGSDQPFISLRELYSQNILIPTLDEQKMIAGILTCLDESIYCQTNKIEALSLHKKGLVQRIFPVMDDVVS
ncbi:restriction endonuclease subunit S [Providencia huashanensis]|uniref:restriction endonuclease subunit S n=1 Tax=Providencia huashanensis TaxID=3037798 RepID=UPI002B003C70|nr:restriction endonuclease subunit S [Providencia sp. 3007]